MKPEDLSLREASAVTVVDLPGTSIAKAKDRMREATDIAGVCKEIVSRTAMDLKGKRYVRCEGWMSIAAAYGCVPSIREVIEEERGVRAIAELRKHDGTVLATAEGYVGLDEPTWATRAMYARRGMAQTRAVSRVCRSAFAFVVTMMDSGLETTPAEEIPAGGDEVVQVISAKPRAPNGPRNDATKIPWGPNKYKHLCDVSDDDLSKLLTGYQKAVDAKDPKWHKINLMRLEAAQKEATQRSFGLSADNNEPPSRDEGAPEEWAR